MGKIDIVPWAFKMVVKTSETLSLLDINTQRNGKAAKLVFSTLSFKTLEIRRTTVFNFPVNNLVKIVWTVLASSFSSCTLLDGVDVFSVPPWIVTVLSKHESAFSVLSFVLSVSWNGSRGSFDGKVFSHIISSRAFSPFFVLFYFIFGEKQRENRWAGGEQIFFNFKKPRSDSTWGSGPGVTSCLFCLVMWKN